MAFELNPDGSLQYVDKLNKTLQKKTTPIKQIDQSIYSYFNLYSCNIETNVVNESIRIVSRDILVHIELEKITDFELSIDTIRLSTRDEFSYYFTFVSPDEAIKGYDKIEAAIAGDIISCTDDLITEKIELKDYDPDFPASGVIFPAIIFIDDLEPFEAVSESDLINKINAIGLDIYSVSLDTGLPVIDFSYQPYKKEFIPKKITFLSRHIKLKTLGLSYFLKMDLLGGKVFTFYNSQRVIPVEDVYSFDNSTLKTIRVYFSKDECNTFEIKDGFNVNIQNTPPVMVGSISNSPKIREYKSSNVGMFNIRYLLANSINTLDTFNMAGNGNNATLDLLTFPIKRLILEDCAITSLLIHKDSVEGLKINNLRITSLIGPFPNLTSCKILNCGLIQTINLDEANLRDLELSNSSVNTLILNSGLNKMYELTVSNTLLNNLLMFDTSLNYLNKVTITNNDELDIADYNSFLNSFILDNNSQGGTMILKNNSVEFTSVELELIYQLRKRGWFVVY